jgi:hypothetical protein
MPERATYLLHLYRSRAVSGWQWAARLEHLPGGESVRFRDPAALLAHLQALVQAAAQADLSRDTAMEATEEGGPQHEGEG